MAHLLLCCLLCCRMLPHVFQVLQHVFQVWHRTLEQSCVTNGYQGRPALCFASPRLIQVPLWVLILILILIP